MSYFTQDDLKKTLEAQVEDQAEAEPSMTSTIEKVHSVLQSAINEVGDRATTYDTPQGEESMPKAVAMFNNLYDTSLTAEQGWQFMAILKMVRSAQGAYKRDNYVDQCAYSAFACKAAEDDR